MDQIQISNYSPDEMYISKVYDPTTKVPSKKKAPPLKGENSTK